MRTNIEINDELLTQAMEATGKTTKKETVEEALRQVVKNYEARKAIADLRGLGWEGDLNEMREGRYFDVIK
jgi:Arc/MetJ family transcription regulator